MLTGSLLLNSLALCVHWRWFGFLGEEPRGLGLDRMPGRIRGNDGFGVSDGGFEAFDQAGRASVEERRTFGGAPSAAVRLQKLPDCADDSADLLLGQR